MTEKRIISHAMEDYLKAIWVLSSGSERVSTSHLARRMHCSPASVTNMIQKLSSLGLVIYRRYQGVVLTEAGRRIALEVIRHHRLLELYLKEVLGYSWDEVHAEAEKLEHVISEEFEDRIDRALGFPTHDPHGHPIPSRDLHVPEDLMDSLWESDPGKVRVGRVEDRDPGMLRHFASIGIFPDAQVEVVGRGAVRSTLCIRIGPQEHQLTEDLARRVFVTAE